MSLMSVLMTGHVPGLCKKLFPLSYTNHPGEWRKDDETLSVQLLQKLLEILQGVEQNKECFFHRENVVRVEAYYKLLNSLSKQQAISFLLCGNPFLKNVRHCIAS